MQNRDFYRVSAIHNFLFDHKDAITRVYVQSISQARKSNILSPSLWRQNKFFISNTVKAAIRRFFATKDTFWSHRLARISLAREISDVLRVSSYNDLRSPVGRK